MKKRRILLFFLTVGLLSSAFLAQGQITILPEEPEGCVIRSNFSVGDLQFKTGDFIPASGPDRYQDWSFICALDKVYYVTNWFFYIIVLVVVLMILYAGFIYVTSAGNPQKGKWASKIITYAIIGLVVALFSKAVPSLIIFLTGTGETDLVVSGDYVLDINIDGSCQVTANPGGTLAGPGQFSLGYDKGTNVSLSVSDNDCSPFLHWSGSCSGNNSQCSINNIMANHNISVNCPTLEFILTGSFSGGGSGTIQVDNKTYQADFAETLMCGQEVSLSAHPQSGSKFIQWIGDCSGNDDSCQLTMDANKSVTANFESEDTNFYDFQLGCQGPGSVEIKKDGETLDNMNCAAIDGDSFSDEFIESSSLVLKAEWSQAGLVFSGWPDGLCDQVTDGSNQSICSLQIDEDKSGQVDFRYPLKVDIQGLGQVEIGGHPYAVDFEKHYLPGQDVTLLAQQLSEFDDVQDLFLNWEGCDTLSGLNQEVCQININESKTVKGIFLHGLGVSFLGDGSGQIIVEAGDSQFDRHSDEGTLIEFLEYGTNIVIQAIPDTGSSFNGWRGDNCEGDQGDCNFVIEERLHILEAEFKKDFDYLEDEDAIITQTFRGPYNSAVNYCANLNPPTETTEGSWSLMRSTDYQARLENVLCNKCSWDPKCCSGENGTIYFSHPNAINPNQYFVINLDPNYFGSYSLWIDPDKDAYNYRCIWYK